MILLGAFIFVSIIVGGRGLLLKDWTCPQGHGRSSRSTTELVSFVLCCCNLPCSFLIIISPLYRLYVWSSMHRESTWFSDILLGGFDELLNLNFYEIIITVSLTRHINKTAKIQMILWGPDVIGWRLFQLLFYYFHNRFKVLASCRVLTFELLASHHLSLYLRSLGVSSSIV